MAGKFKSTNKSYKDHPKFKEIRIDEIRQLLSYDPETGSLIWLQHRGSTVLAGDSAQKPQMSLMGVRITTSHVIWFLMKEKWPDDTIIHLNKNNDDYRWKNLADVSRQHALMFHMSQDGEGIKSTSSGQYSVSIDVDGQTHVVGVYSAYSVASKVYDACIFLKEKLMS